jgi:hypothetical protein
MMHRRPSRRVLGGHFSPPGNSFLEEGTMSHRLLAAALLALAPTLASAQVKSAPSPLEGVWKITEVITTGANAATNSSPQPNLVIFAMGHYSIISVGGTTASTAVPPAKDPNNPTDAEKIASYEHWKQLTANAGTYEVKGTSMTRRAMVAKNHSVMTATAPTVVEFKVDGNTLWLTSKSTDGQPESQTRTKLTRLR